MRPRDRAEQRQHGDLRRERLGGGDADLGPGVQVDAAVGLAGDGAADDVARCRASGGPCASHSRRAASVSAVSPDWRDGEDERVSVDRRVAVAELAGVLDLDRDAGELLDQVLADQGRVPAGAAGGEDDAVDLRAAAAASGSGRRTGPWPRRGRGGRAWRSRPSRGCSKISLSMKCGNSPVVRPRFGEFELADLHLGGAALEVVHVEARRGERDHVVVVEINDLPGVRDDGGDVAGQEVLARPQRR